MEILSLILWQIWFWYNWKNWKWVFKKDMAEVSYICASTQNLLTYFSNNKQPMIFFLIYPNQKTEPWIILHIKSI